MKQNLKFSLVDAFTTSALAGNPCAVVFGADALTDREMLFIAKEMNQSETVFLMKSKDCDLKARYFTPGREIPLAGHPTIAAIHGAIEAGVLIPRPGNADIAIELNDGPIRVQVETNNGIQIIKMFQRVPEFLEVHDPNVVLPIFGLEHTDLLPNSVIQTVSTGTRQLMVAVRSIESLQKISMNINAYKSYREKMNFFSPHLFCVPGLSEDASTFARHPGVPPESLEDPFTGSATGAMAVFLWRYNYINSPQFIAEQGHWMGRPGRAYVEVFGSRENIEGVSVAGSAVTTATGTLMI